MEEEMEKIYLIGTIFTIIEIGLYLFSPIPLIIFVIFLLGSFWFIFKVKNKEVYILSFLFLFRILFVVNFNEYQVGDIVTIKSEISNGVGKIERIENKTPLLRKNIYLSIEDGKYEILGEITGIKPRYILLEEDLKSTQKEYRKYYTKSKELQTFKDKYEEANGKRRGIKTFFLWLAP